jgi:hypothetical protein
MKKDYVLTHKAPRQLGAPQSTVVLSKSQAAYLLARGQIAVPTAKAKRTSKARRG